jgi:hypothetical protein
MKNKILTLVLSTLTLFVNAQSDCTNDVTNPYIVDFQPEITVSCDHDLSAIRPIIQDNCDDSVEVVFLEEIFQSGISNVYDVFRIYRAFDNAGNGLVETQIIHVVDEAPPVFTPMPTQTIACWNNPEFTQAMAVDNCGWTVLMYQDFVDGSNPCQTVYTRLWTAYDESGNTSNASEIIIAVDTIPPTISGEIYIEVDEGTSLDTLFATASEPCSSPIFFTYVDTEVSGNSYIRVYTATDGCGNTSTFEQIIHVNVVVTDPVDDEEDAEEESKRVAICHRLGNGNFITIYVAQPAVQAHLNHGDTLGPCDTTINWHNQSLPMQMGLEFKDGKISKTVRQK